MLWPKRCPKHSFLGISLRFAENPFKKSFPCRVFRRQLCSKPWTTRQSKCQNSSWHSPSRWLRIGLRDLLFRTFFQFYLHRIITFFGQNNFKIQADRFIQLQFTNGSFWECEGASFGARIRLDRKLQVSSTGGGTSGRAKCLWET